MEERLRVDPAALEYLGQQSVEVHVHAPVIAARASLLDPPGGKETGLIARAANIARTIKALRPDRSPDSEIILSSICQFDVLGCLAVAAGRQDLSGKLLPEFRPVPVPAVRTRLPSDNQ